MTHRRWREPDFRLGFFIVWSTHPHGSQIYRRHSLLQTIAKQHEFRSCGLVIKIEQCLLKNKLWLSGSSGDRRTLLIRKPVRGAPTGVGRGPYPRFHNNPSPTDNQDGLHSISGRYLISSGAYHLPVAMIEGNQTHEREKTTNDTPIESFCGESANFPRLEVVSSQPLYRGVVNSNVQ